MIPIISDFKKTILSNFYPVNIVYDKFGLHEYNFPTLEHLYMSFKSSDEEYDHHVEMLLSDSSPWSARRYGRNSIKIDDMDDWNNKRIECMALSISLKFDPFEHPHICKNLIDTYPAVLVEGNDWHDNFWGYCFCDRCKDTVKQNNLGVLLMMRRMELMNTPQYADYIKNNFILTF